MRIARIRTRDGTTTHAVVEDQSARPIQGDIFGDWKAAGKPIPLEKVKLLPPLTPVNLLCFGRNYKAHAEEGGADLPSAPLLFIKANSCVIASGEPIVIPSAAPDRVDYEAELAVVIGRPARNVRRQDALAYVFGYTCANDVSARDVQNKDGQWSRAKSFDTFGPLGPWIETSLDPNDVRVETRLNGDIRQAGQTSDMVFGVATLIEYITTFMTLLPGDVLLTGTPEGVGKLEADDVVEVEVDGVGTLRNTVVS